MGFLKKVGKKLDEGRHWVGKQFRHVKNAVVDTVIETVDKIPLAGAAVAVFVEVDPKIKHRRQDQSQPLSVYSRLSLEIYAPGNLERGAVVQTDCGQFQVLEHANIGDHVRAALVRAPNGEYIVVIRGTDNWENAVIADLSVLLKGQWGVPVDRFCWKLRDLITGWEQKYGMQIDAMTGHSLGGFVAGNTFSYDERPSMLRVGFNAPYMPNEPNMVHIRLDHDPASGLAQHVGAPRITLQNSSIKDAHSMDRMHGKVVENERQGLFDSLAPRPESMAERFAKVTSALSAACSAVDLVKCSPADSLVQHTVVAPAQRVMLKALGLPV